MKRQYMQPQAKVVKMKMNKMLCGSPTGSSVYGTQAEEGSAGFSRESNYWDEE